MHVASEPMSISYGVGPVSVPPAERGSSPFHENWRVSTVTSVPRPRFRPTLFVDISDTLDKKIEAMRVYSGEIREFPHPRSPEALEAIARRWGSVAGFLAAEAFELLRALRPTSRR